MNPVQALMQAMTGGMNPMGNPMVKEILSMKQQGMTPEQAINQLSQKYPSFKNAVPFLQGKTPEQMGQTAQNFIQEAGVNPADMANQLRRFM